MNIADQIADILERNPGGLKASEIAAQIGCTRKTVNSYLYSHKDMYEQHEGYVWTAKSVQKKIQYLPRTQQTLPVNTNSVSIKQTVGSTVVSTLTITPNGESYHINSTNNQIICCDCKNFFSIHALACPVCGCPISYATDYYFNKYHPKIVYQQDQQADQEKAAQRRIRQEENKAECLAIIDEIAYYHDNRLYKTELESLLKQKSKAVLQKAVERAKNLNKLNAPIYMTRETYAKLICSEDLYFESAFSRAAYIKSIRDGAPWIYTGEWDYLLSLDEDSFDSGLQKLQIEKKKSAEEAAQRHEEWKKQEAQKQEMRLTKMCDIYRISKEHLFLLIDKYGSKECLLEKLSLIDTIGGDVRHRIDLLSYIDYPESLRELVKTLK